jgi:hypothetical protein
MSRYGLTAAHHRQEQKTRPREEARDNPDWESDGSAPRLHFPETPNASRDDRGKGYKFPDESPIDEYHRDLPVPTAR